MLWLQAKSLGHGFKAALELINPVSLFRFDAVRRITETGGRGLYNLYEVKIVTGIGCVLTVYVTGYKLVGNKLCKFAESCMIDSYYWMILDLSIYPTFPIIIIINFTG